MTSFGNTYGDQIGGGIFRVPDDAGFDALEGLGESAVLSLNVLYPSPGQDTVSSGTKNPGFWASLFSSPPFIPLQMQLSNSTGSSVSGSLYYVWTERELFPTGEAVVRNASAQGVSFSLDPGETKTLEDKFTLVTPGAWWAIDVNLTVYASVPGLPPVALFSGPFKVK